MYRKQSVKTSRHQDIKEQFRGRIAKKGGKNLGSRRKGTEKKRKNPSAAGAKEAFSRHSTVMGLSSPFLFCLVVV